MQLRDGQFVEQRVCLLEALRRLTSAAHHHVNTDKRIRHQLLDTEDLVSEELAVVVTVHQLQYFVATALQRNMEMGHEGTALVGAPLNKLIAQQVGLQTADAIALDSLHLIQGFHQINEALAGGLAEVSDVYARQDDFLTAFNYGFFCLLHQ